MLAEVGNVGELLTKSSDATNLTAFVCCQNAVAFPETKDFHSDAIEEPFLVPQRTFH